MVMATLTNQNQLTIESQWLEIADLKVSLRSNVAFFQHQYRGETWYVVLDKASGHQFRCSNHIQQVLIQLDGNKTVGQSYNEVNSSLKNNSPSRDDITLILLKLAQADMLQGDILMDDKQRAAKQRHHNQLTGWRKFAKPFAIRIPLFDPERLLEKLLPAAKLLLTRSAFIIWALWIIWAVMTSLNSWPELQHHWETRFLDPYNLLWLWLLYPIVKGLHEIGHALTTKYWGGQVHEIGIMLLVFMPMPYVDASSSATFCNKHQRILVAAMGIMVELFLAASGLYIWHALDSGTIKDIAFNVAMIGSFSTLLFNGNPLLRFDGYYVLSDWIEIPNLGTRSNQYLGYLIKKYAFKFDSNSTFSLMQGERRWLIGYGLLSGCYRIFITFSIAFYIAGKFFIIGILLALWALYSQMLQPLCRSASLIIRQAKAYQRQRRTFTVVSASLLFSYAFLFVLPINSSSYARGIIMLPEYAYVRAASDGFIQKVLAENGQSVKPDDILISLENHQLLADIKINRAKQIELDAHYNNALNQEPLTASMYKDELATLEAEYYDLQKQSENLQLTSNSHGIFTSVNPEDLPGRFVNKGELIAHVVDFKELNARVVVAQQAVDQVRRHTQNIEIRLSSEPAKILTAKNLREVPSGSQLLPSKLLGSQAGGQITIDASDPSGTKAIRTFFQFDIQLPALQSGDAYAGQQVMVKFVHQKETLGKRWYRQIEQLLTENFYI